MEQRFLFARQYKYDSGSGTVGSGIMQRFFWFVIMLALFVIFMPGMRPV
ncbi:hypothetical protein Desku_2463 [Desulfofundulus kuznetsovii DSM 6115]|uniref:Uncharacterized protein n=1 Tax=Desulfofundulus kuznetsovii (strain DSM 6115 / VKM B-1805 / 17) TaxID=760568 RepID=A0AAU8PD86_DESK7|nr:hypothetical protein Desku_2463 [Desulfofundulus kuznetsovii DSM 6115]